TGGAVLLRFDNLGDRKDLVDHRPQAATLDEGPEVVQILAVRLHEDGMDLEREQEVEELPCEEARRAPGVDVAAARHDHALALLRRSAADAIEHDIVILARSGEIRRLVVNQPIGTQALDEREARP